MTRYNGYMSRQNGLLSAAWLSVLLLMAAGCANALKLPQGEPPAVPPVFDDPQEILPFLPPDATPGPSIAPTPLPTRRPSPSPSTSPVSNSEPAPATSQSGSEPELPASGSTRDSILKVQAIPPAREGFSLVFMGDSRNSTPFTDGGEENYLRTIEAVNRLGALFVIHGGDFTFDNLQRHWRRVLDIQKNLTIPLMTVVGNHDALFGRSFFEGNFVAPNANTGLDDYSFDYGGVRFIALDNANATITPAQLTWFQEQLQTGLVKIVIAHHPPRLGNWTNHSLNDAKASTQWVQLLDQARVSMVLLSHIHLFDDSTRRGSTQYIVSGGAGAPLSPANFGISTRHVVLIRVEPGAKLTYRMVPIV